MNHCEKVSLRKIRRGLTAFVTFLACTSAVALGAVLSMSLPASAGTCTSINSDGVYVCSRRQDGYNDSPIMITAALGRTLTVTQNGNFGVDGQEHSEGSAMAVTAEAVSNGSTAELKGRINNTRRGGAPKTSGNGVTFNTVMGNSRSDAFEAGEFVMDASNLTLEPADGNRSIAANTGFSHRASIFESYPAVLASLSSLESLRQSRNGRSWVREDGVGFWGKADVGIWDAEAKVSTTGASYEVMDARMRFGVDAPVAGGLVFGANIAAGSSDADVSAASGNGSIESELFSGGLNVSWVDENFYIDTRAQYAAITSDISSPGEVIAVDNEAETFSAAGEWGYRLRAGRLFLIPSAQLIWGDVDFDGFTAPDNKTVVVVDGETLTARFGIVADTEWIDETDVRGGIRAGLDLRFPLDGETVTGVSGAELTSVIESPIVEFGFGMDYEWWDGYSVNADFGFSRGNEVREYRANVGMRVDF